MANQSESGGPTFPSGGSGNNADGSSPQVPVPRPDQRDPNDNAKVESEQYNQQQFDLMSSKVQHSMKKQFKWRQRRAMRKVTKAPKNRRLKVPYTDANRRLRVRDISYTVFIAGIDVTDLLPDSGIDSITQSGRDGNGSASFTLSNFNNVLTITRDNIQGKWKTTDGFKKQLYLRKKFRNEEFLQLLARSEGVWQGKTSAEKLKSLLASTPLGDAVKANKKAGKKLDPTANTPEAEAARKVQEALDNMGNYSQAPAGKIGDHTYNKFKNWTVKLDTVEAAKVVDDEDGNINFEEKAKLEAEENTIKLVKDVLGTQFSSNSAAYLYNLSPGRCIIDRFDTIRIFRRDPVVAGNNWMPVFTGFILDRPKSTSYTENPQSNYAISCGDIRELMQLMRVQMNPQSLLTTNTGSDGTAGITVIEPLLYSGFFKDLVDMRDGQFSHILAQTSFTQAMMWLTLGIPAERVTDKATQATVEQIDTDLPIQQTKLENKLKKLVSLLDLVSISIPQLQTEEDSTIGLFGPLWNTMEELMSKYGQYGVSSVDPENQVDVPLGWTEVAGLWTEVKVLDATIKELQSIRQQEVAKIFRGPIAGVGNFTLGETVMYPQGSPQKLLEDWHHKMLFGDLIPEGKEVDEYGSGTEGVYGYLTSAEMYFIGLNSDGGQMYSPWEGSVHFLLPSAANEVAYNFIQYDQVTDLAERREWRTRLELINDLCERVDYQWYVNPAGDIVFEFPMYDFYPEDFGPSHPVDLTSNVSNSFHKTDPLPNVFRVVDTPVTTDSSDEASNPVSIIHVIGGYVWQQEDPNYPAAQMPQAWAWCPAMFARYGTNTEEVSIPWFAEGNEKSLEAWALITFQKRLMAISNLSASHDDRPYLLPNRPFHVLPEGKMGLITSLSYTLAPPPSNPTTSVELGLIRTQATDGSWLLITGSPHMPLSYKTLFTQFPGLVTDVPKINFGDCSQETTPEKVTKCIEAKIKEYNANPGKYIDYVPEDPTRKSATIDMEAWIDYHKFEGQDADQVRKSGTAIKLVSDIMGLPHYYMFAIAGAETGGTMDPKSINYTDSGGLGAVGMGQFTGSGISGLNNILSKPGAAAKYNLPEEFQGYHVTKLGLTTPDADGMISVNGTEMGIEMVQAYLMGVLYHKNAENLKLYEGPGGGNPWLDKNGEPSPEMILLAYGRGGGCLNKATNAALEELSNKSTDSADNANALIEVLAPTMGMDLTKHAIAVSAKMSSASFIDSLPTAYVAEVLNNNLLQNVQASKTGVSLLMAKIKNNSDGGTFKSVYASYSTEEKAMFRSLFPLGQVGKVFDQNAWGLEAENQTGTLSSYYGPQLYSTTWVNTMNKKGWGNPGSVAIVLDTKVPDDGDGKFHTKSYSPRSVAQTALANLIAGGGSDLPDYEDVKALTRDYMSGKKTAPNACRDSKGRPIEGLGHEQNWIDKILPKMQTASTANIKGVKTRVVLAGGTPLEGGDNPEEIW